MTEKDASRRRWTLEDCIERRCTSEEYVADLKADVDRRLGSPRTGWYELTVHGRYGPAAKSRFPAGNSLVQRFEYPLNDVLEIEVTFTPEVDRG